MRLWVLFLLLSTLGISSVFAKTESIPIPSQMKYFSENQKFSANDSVLVQLDLLANKMKWELFREPYQLPFDFVIVDEKFQKEILVSVNRRTNPQYQNKIYKHSLGHLFQLRLHNQQVALFAVSLNEDELQEMANFFKPYLQAQWQSLFIHQAEASETAKGTGSEVPSSAANLRSPALYALGENFKGCGVGLKESVLYPWEAAKIFGTSAQSLYEDPPAWWGRSVQDFQALGKKAAGFPEFLAKKWKDFNVEKVWKAFQSKPPHEQSQMWCEFVGVPALGGSLVKVTKGASKPARVGSSNETSLSAEKPSSPSSSGKTVESKEKFSGATSPSLHLLEERISKMKLNLEKNMNKNHIEKFTDPNSPFNPVLMPSNPKISGMVIKVYNRMHNPTEVAAHLEKLMKEAADNIIASKIPKELEALQKGELSRNAVLRILVQRAKKRGETFQTMKDMDDADFFGVVAKGPFFDKAFYLGSHPQSVLHGMDSHLIQRDLVADVFPTPASHKEFYEYLGKNLRGQKVWSELYDRGPRYNTDLSSPAGITNLIGPYLGTQ